MKRSFKVVLGVLGYVFFICAPCFSHDDNTERKIEKVYYTDGKLFSETDLFSDRNNGFYRTYHPNGQMATEIRYKDGKQIYDRAFDEKGLTIVRNGLFKTYYADGHLASVGEYYHDVKHGTEKFFYYDGATVVDIWHYMDGRKVGEHIRNDSQGRFVSSEDFGYPSYYVRGLWNIIIVLVCLVIMALLYGLRRTEK